jgi:hypothetical protein
MTEFQAEENNRLRTPDDISSLAEKKWGKVISPAEHLSLSFLLGTQSVSQSALLGCRKNVRCRVGAHIAFAGSGV